MIIDFLYQSLRLIVIVGTASLLIRYLFVMLIAPIYDLKEILKAKRYQQINSPPVSISVIIPAWNEAVGITKTIQSVIDNHYPNLEIIVINDGSTDDSDKIIKTFIKKHPDEKIIYHYQANAGKGHALNQGLKLATSEIIMTMDADSILDDQALYHLSIHFQDPELAGLVGRVEIANYQSLIGYLQYFEYSFGFYAKKANSLLGIEYIFGGACAAFRKSLTFDQFGEFDTANLTEDIEMSLRTQFHGLRSKYASDVVCYTEGASSIYGLVKQRIRWKKGRFETFDKYREMFFSRKPQHNKLLTWGLLPSSVLLEFQLLIEPISLSYFFIDNVIKRNPLGLALSISFFAIGFIILAIFEVPRHKLRFGLSWIYLWPLIYILVWVEYLALMQSVYLSIRKRQLQWQKWERKGI
ncbi:glycosyltransferase family 2 protein [Candidatus Saccharibacteria bacterium]|nr:glycosyltransferase family 2 protein [Candidatus Saccharibacteria bacterium]MCB9834725.1 glycosyltransferase family 2 protein [Candidatus Nomurabacteria bacterium]